ncbi:hypothetical protein [Helicobacter ganmani]|nr:hypothetical protein [Helicobacter ganmani]
MKLPNIMESHNEIPHLVLANLCVLFFIIARGFSLVATYNLA